MEPDIEAIVKATLLRLFEEANEVTLEGYIREEIGPDSGLTMQQLQSTVEAVKLRMSEMLTE